MVHQGYAFPKHKFARMLATIKGVGNPPGAMRTGEIISAGIARPTDSTRRRPTNIDRVGRADALRLR